MSTPKKRSKVSDAPMAVTSAGETVVNVTHLNGMARVIAAVEKLVAPGQQFFVGVVVPDEMNGTLLKEVDDAIVDVVGRVGVKINVRASSRSSGRHRGQPADASPRRKRGVRP
jgi:hypothetical protein